MFPFLRQVCASVYDLVYESLYASLLVIHFVPELDLAIGRHFNEIQCHLSYSQYFTLITELYNKLSFETGSLENCK